jgi:hypothetical protein
VSGETGSWGLLTVPILICIGLLLFVALSSPAAAGPVDSEVIGCQPSRSCTPSLSSTG